MRYFAKPFLLLAVAAALHAQTLPGETAPSPRHRLYLFFCPGELELGGYGTDFSNGGGWWRGFDSTLWFRKSSKFIPAFTFDNRTTNSGTQRYYSLFAYANWTPNFFTTQSIAGSAASDVILFPRLRLDGKAWWKLPPSRRIVAGLGVTRYTLGGGQNGLIVNPSVSYYRTSWVFDGEGFLNQTNPGGLWSGSGLFLIQYGQEGKRLAGVSFGVGGRSTRKLRMCRF